MKTSCIEHPKNQQLVIIREDYLAICDGNHCAAAILNIFEFWANIKIAHRDQAEIENEIIEREGGEDFVDQTEWVYKSQDDLHAELLGLFGLNKIGSSLKWLKENGFLDTRTNPKFKWDHTIQYQLHRNNVHAALRNYSNRIFKIKASKDDNQSFRDSESKGTIPETTTQNKKERGETPAPKTNGKKPNHIAALENSMDTSKLAWLDAWRDAHFVKPLALQGRERGDALEQVEGLIEMGCTPEDLTAYIQEREKQNKSTVWRFVVSEIHTYMARKQAAAVTDAALQETAEQIGATAYYDTATDTTNRWDIANQRWIYEQGNTL